MARRVRNVVRLTECLLVLCALAPIMAQADEEPRRVPTVDTEHIFGFTEGANIGGKGELELENTAIGRLGRPGSSFTVLNNETALRYGVAEGFRASFGVLTDYHDIHNVSGFGDRTAPSFSGLSSQFRWQPLERDGIGLTLSFAPQWRRIDDTSGQGAENYTLPIGLLADTALVADTVFAALNLTYSPIFTHNDGKRQQQDDPLEISQAIAVAVDDGVFLGAEIRHITRDQAGFFTGHALFIGPSVFVKVSDDISFKVAWSSQIPDETTGRLDLVNFERHQAIAVLVKGF